LAHELRHLLQFKLFPIEIEFEQLLLKRDSRDTPIPVLLRILEQTMLHELEAFVLNAGTKKFIPQYLERFKKEHLGNRNLSREEEERVEKIEQTWNEIHREVQSEHLVFEKEGEEREIVIAFVRMISFAQNSTDALKKVRYANAYISEAWGIE
jgi:hypothetical protein